MKKILLAFLIVFACTGEAQNTEINNQLKLNTVYQGAKTDSILVRGADKLVKYVPQSSIVVNSAGVDGSETKVIAGTNTTVSGLGTIASPYVVNSAGVDGSETKVIAGTNTTVSGLGTIASPYVVNSTGGGTPDGTLRTLGGGTFTSTLQQVSDNLNVKSPLYISNAGVTATGNIASNINNTVFGHNAGTAIMGSSTQSAFFGLLSGNVATGQANAGFGARSLQALTTGTTNTGLGSQALMGLTTGTNNIGVGGGCAIELTTGNDNIIVGRNSGRVMTTGDYNTIIGSNSTPLDVGSNYNVVIGSIPSAQRAVLQNNIIIADGQGNRRITVDNTGTVRLPAQTIALITAGGAQGIITKGYGDIAYGAVNNTTTTALSSATLTSTYSTALIGFRVHALSVSGGAVVYEKASTGWIQMPVTIVP